MPEVRNDRVTISYSDEGAGRPVVLLHGHTLDRRVWLPVVPHLLAVGLRVIRPDLRGHGRSDRPDVGYHPSHHASDLMAVMDAAGLDRAVVAGFSFGGGVAMEAALTQPGRLNGLGLVASTMPDRPFEDAFMANLRQVAGVIRSQGVAAAMAGPWAESPLFAHSFEKPGIREAVASIVAGFPGAEFLATQRDTVERDWTVPERLGEITMPAAVMVGECEMPGFRAYADEASSSIPGASLEVVPDCGHLLPLEAPGTVANMIIELCRR
ncbi:MAG: alpha/beta hydrolase [Thermoanaerobaculales bacterium]|jgi:pimeloyl-ACP methyl ester carboxylesterase|nr:alpha/beta hydrolase [Thermoanaerobaculales bacterium]